MRLRILPKCARKLHTYPVYSLLLDLFPMESKYHPWALLILSFPLYQVQTFLLIAAVALGYLHSIGIIHNISPEHATVFERFFYFPRAGPLCGFITVDTAREYSFAREVGEQIQQEPIENLQAPENSVGLLGAQQEKKVEDAKESYVIVSVVLKR